MEANSKNDYDDEECQGSKASTRSSGKDLGDGKSTPEVEDLLSLTIQAALLPI